jgi:hypothetical protein
VTAATRYACSSRAAANVEVWNGSDMGRMRLRPGSASASELSSSSAGWRVQLPRGLLGGTTGSTSGSSSPSGQETRSSASTAGRTRLLAVRARAAPVRERPGRRRRRKDRCRPIEAVPTRSTIPKGTRRSRQRLPAPVVTPANARPGRPVHGSRDCSATRDGRSGRDRKRECTIRAGANSQAGPRPDPRQGVATCKFASARASRVRPRCAAR